MCVTKTYRYTYAGTMMVYTITANSIVDLRKKLLQKMSATKTTEVYVTSSKTEFPDQAKSRIFISNTVFGVIGPDVGITCFNGNTWSVSKKTGKLVKRLYSDIGF